MSRASRDVSTFGGGYSHRERVEPPPQDRNPHLASDAATRGRDRPSHRPRPRAAWPRGDADPERGRWRRRRCRTFFSPIGARFRAPGTRPEPPTGFPDPSRRRGACGPRVGFEPPPQGLSPHATSGQAQAPASRNHAPRGRPAQRWPVSDDALANRFGQRDVVWQVGRDDRGPGRSR